MIAKNYMPINGELVAQYENAYAEDNPVMLRGRQIAAKRKADNIIAICASVPHDRIVEIGAGEGAVLAALNSRSFGASFTALEIAPAPIEKIRAREIPSISARLFDGSKIPFGDAAFDLAIMSHVVEHLEHPRELIKEAARVARFVFIEVPLEDARGTGNDWRWNFEGHINYYTQRAIRFLVQSCGLKIREQRITDWEWETYRFENGLAMGTAKFIVKRSALAIAPRLATKLCTFNSVLLAGREGFKTSQK